MVDLLLDFRTWPVERPTDSASTGSNAAAPASGRTIVLTTHQAHLAEPLAETTLTMRAGSIVSVTAGLPASANGPQAGQ
jgi:hypothetical protein